MPDSSQSVSSVIRFGPFDADLQTQELRKHGVRLRLPGQSFQILKMLLERQGQLVTREDFQKALWPSDTFVDFDHSLNAAVNRLREALGDSADEPHLIETLPRRGYRFIGTITPPAAEAPSAIPMAAGPADAAAERRPEVISRWKWSRIAAVLFTAVACILVATLAVLRWHRSTSSSLSVMQFTALPGRAAYPALSPDGSRIAFAWNAGEESGSKGFDLYVKAIGSENLQRLTNDSSGFLAPAWSSDGAEIAFQRESRDQSGIYLVPAQGGPERKLHSTNPSFGLSLQISWSPDGKSIAFADSPVSGGHRRLHLLSPETLESMQIEHNEACLDEGGPAFSHDGGQLAYSCYTASGDFGLIVATSSGAMPRLIKALPDYVEAPVWASGDKRLIFRQAGDHNSVRELTIADGSMRDLPFGEDAWNPTLSATGEKISYEVVSTRNSIWRSDLLDPRAESAKLISTSRDEGCPQYSPNGKHIAFASNRSGNFEMWMSDADGKNVLQLTNLKNPSTGTPSWSPDSHKIVFDSRISVHPDQYHADLYIVDTAERMPRKLVLDTGEASMPSWSHDGKWIYFIGGGRVGGERIYRVAPGGGHATAISTSRGHFPLESFDGQSVYFEVPPGFLQAASLNPTGTESRVEGMPQLAWYANWTIVRDGIYFFPEHDPLLLSYYDFASKRVRPVLRVGAYVDAEASVSPDNRYIVYSQVNVHSDIMLVDHFR